MPSFRVCPDCSERLSPDALRCACGWQQNARKSKDGVTWNHVCTWKYGDLACKNPVGLFRHGETSGLCIFHRHHPDGQMGADIARESAIHDAESYNYAAKKTAYGEGSVHEKKLRAMYAASPSARRGGNLADGMEDWIARCKERSCA